MKRLTSITSLILLGFCIAAGPATQPSLPPNVQVVRPTTQPTPADPIPAGVVEKGTLILHLPGIGGFLGCDRHMVTGLSDAGVTAHIEIYDWTEHDPGIHDLHAYDRNQKEAQRIADMIVAHHKADPTSKILLTAHSGGCGIAIWALEKLPPDVNVQTVLLMAPALSPTYDLSMALTHVQDHVYVFSSIYDTIVLNTGTKLFGTIDGVDTAAAGFGGFVMPPNANADAYKKLTPRPYDKDWMKLNNLGDHVGAMSRQFAATILAPLLGIPAKAS
jgi:predicted alpha/beta hydrolase family esterase